jgi:hypothetical protein
MCFSRGIDLRQNNHFEKNDEMLVIIMISLSYHKDNFCKCRLFILKKNIFFSSIKQQLIFDYALSCLRKPAGGAPFRVGLIIRISANQAGPLEIGNIM